MKRRSNWRMAIICVTLALMACTGNRAGKVSINNNAALADSLKIMPEYAKGFEVSYPNADMALLDIHDPEGNETQTFHYALLKRGSNAEIPMGYTKINIPVESVICMTSLQLSNFIKLGLTDKVVGVTSTRHLFNEKMNEQIRTGKTHKIGIEGNFDNEVIMAINPDMIFISPFKRGGYDAIRNVDIPLVPHLGYKELTPLGQAEWLKVVGLLTGHEAKANATFSQIAKRYNDLKALAANSEPKPTVMSGQMQSGYWYAPGGASFLAQLFRDAGGDYFMKNNTESGGIKLDYETVYSQAAYADYWRMVNSYDGEWNYDVLKAEDSRYADFKAYKDHGVVYCNMTQVPFYERMPVEPDEVLADFISVFHPELLPEHQPRYYHLVK